MLEPKYARSETPLEVKMASERIVPSFPGEAFSKFAALEDNKTEEGYLYVRTRAISSRVNKNNDGWPSEELARAYKTFIGRPVFVDHNNSDPKRTRGVIVDSKLHVEDDKTSALDPYYSTAPDNHKPPTWVEILIEVDAHTFPKLAKAIKNGWVDATSMGANIDKSVCSVCSNEATTPSEYCDHVKKKGATFEITADNGEKVQKKAWEDCYGVNFFEDSFVFDPADETALNLGYDTKMTPLAHEAGFLGLRDQHRDEDYSDAPRPCPDCGAPLQLVDDPLAGSYYYCPNEHKAVIKQIAKKAIVDLGPGGHCPKCGNPVNEDGKCETPGCPYNVEQSEQQLAKVAHGHWWSCQGCHNLVEEARVAKGHGHCPHCGASSFMPTQPGKRGSYNPLIKVADGYHVSCRDCGNHMINVTDNDTSFYHCTGCGRVESNLSTLDPFRENISSVKTAATCPYCRKHVPSEDKDGDTYQCPHCGERFDADDKQSKVAAADPKVIELAQRVLRDPQAAVGNFRISPQEVIVLKALAQAVLVEGTTSPFLAKMADFGMGGGGIDHERVINHEPQADMTKAPGKVDTLQDDIECPNCHSDYLQADPDGILRCPTCSYEQPPTGLDNPDLGAAQRENDKDLSTPQGGPAVRAGEEDLDLGPNADSTGTQGDNFIQPIKPLQAATKKNVTTEEISEMIWKRKIQTDSAAEADAFLPRTAGSVEVPIEYAGGIHFGTHAAFQKHGLNATVHYPGAPQPLPIPGNAMQHFMLQINAQKAQGLESPGQLVVRVDAPDDQLDKAVNLIHTGGTENTKEAADDTIKQQPKKEVLTPQPDKPEETVESDEFAPVTSDRRVIKREETPDGHRTEQIIEETGELGMDDEPKDEKKDEKEESEESKGEESESSEESEGDDKTPDFLKKKEPVAASVDPTARILEALAVAEEYVDANLLPKGAKLAFVGQLENLPEGEVAAYRAALALFKSANVPTRRVTHASRALPRLGSVTGTVPTNNGTTSLDDVPLEAIFL